MYIRPFIIIPFWIRGFCIPGVCVLTIRENIVYIVIIIMASNAGLLLFIPILDSLNIKELLNS